MPTFADKYGKFLDRLEDPGMSIQTQVVTTCGQGGHVQNYHPPTKAVVKTTQDLFDNLQDFDKNPTEQTFAALQATLAALKMKAVRVKSSTTNPATIEQVKEWIYITPDANNQGNKADKAAWTNISVNTGFNLSYHVGSTSTIAGSDEHNGGDGCFRVVNAMVEQGAQLKLIMHNSRNRATSPKVGKRYQGDFAHSTATIDYPVMGRLAHQNFVVINIHGMASKSFGLFVNNWNSKFTKGPSFPTLLGIALAKRFTDKNFRFGGTIPGYIVVDGQKRPLSPPGNKKASADSIFYSGKGMQNTNVIGNHVNRIVTADQHKQPGDSGHSVHIEFGIIRDAKHGAKMRLMAAAMAEAMFWWNNYDDAKHNPWNLAKTRPDIFNDMSKYGTLFPAMDAETAKLVGITDANLTPEDEQFMAKFAPSDAETMGDDDVVDDTSADTDFDAEVANPEEVLTTDETDNADDGFDPSPSEEYATSSQQALDVVSARIADLQDQIKALQEVHGTISASSQHIINNLKAAEDAIQATMDTTQTHLADNSDALVQEAIASIKQPKPVVFTGKQRAKPASQNTAKLTLT